jgi:lipoate-protein ligase B
LSISLQHNVVNVLDLGLIEYVEARNLQEQYAAEIARGERGPTLLLLEHPHVFTFGSRGQAKNLLWDKEHLRERGVAVQHVDRGGDVTYHGPGQLVGYPLLPLLPWRPDRSQPPSPGFEQHPERPVRSDSVRLPRPDYVGYIRKLEKSLIAALADLGVAAGQIPGLTGVWVQADVHSRCPRCKPEDRKKPAKLAAIGVKVDVNGVSRHGFALNVDPDMSYWNGIVACGLQDQPAVSLADLLSPAPGMDRVKQAVTAAFGEVFEYEMG